MLVDPGIKRGNQTVPHLDDRFIKLANFLKGHITVVYFLFIERGSNLFFRVIKGLKLAIR
jgi:hypothetical protein